MKDARYGNVQANGTLVTTSCFLARKTNFMLAAQMMFACKQKTTQFMRSLLLTSKKIQRKQILSQNGS